MPNAAADRWKGASELGVAALLLACGVVALVDASTLSDNAASRGPLGSAVMPTAVGILLVGCALALTIDVFRGGRGEMDGGEDIDLDSPPAWPAFTAVAGVFLANAVLIETLGWPISGALLFWGSAVALGSRRFLRDIAIALLMSFGSYFLFVEVMRIHLPAGILSGVL
ncbi:tripartite tricarboxylate transporter TctB family protein [Ornithinimicrobium ciconiae]|uniref:Tripartite tricarboxylate transporter TctB family protein n=1 Tax=Ornithinimicrobium ciconiae TaxID=2594265 RepID=A0A516GG25_9MICO|nr:tripartite tricarboxylate transporter TctB family protein [Ornithinimicrobium ciconiae]